MILLIALYFQFVVTPCSYVYWLLFGKHRLTSAEKEYNGKIEEICARLDAKYAECVDWLPETARQSHGQYTDEIEEDMQVLHNIDIMPMIAGMIEAEFGINPFSRIHVGPGRFRVQMPGTLLYSEAKKTLDDEFDAMNLSENWKRCEAVTLGWPFSLSTTVSFSRPACAKQNMKWTNGVRRWTCSDADAAVLSL